DPGLGVFDAGGHVMAGAEEPGLPVELDGAAERERVGEAAGVVGDQARVELLGVELARERVHRQRGLVTERVAALERAEIETRLEEIAAGEVAGPVLADVV